MLRAAAIALASGLLGKDELLARYESIRKRCFAAAEEADRRPKLVELGEIVAPLAPYTPKAVIVEAERSDYAARRLEVFGGEQKLPEILPPRHLAIQINQALHDLFCKYPEALLFGEDVAQKGGVYTVTKGLHKAFRNARVFNTLLDETITWTAQGYANMGLLPCRNPVLLFPQRLRQIRGEAASLQFFSNDQFRNPWSFASRAWGTRRASRHFHNDNSLTALSRIPGSCRCASRGDDARRCCARWPLWPRWMAGSAFLEPMPLHDQGCTRRATARAFRGSPPDQA